MNRKNKPSQKPAAITDSEFEEIKLPEFKISEPIFEPTEEISTNKKITPVTPVYIRHGASQLTSPLAILGMDEIREVKSETEEWYELICGGYVMKKYVKIIN